MDRRSTAALVDNTKNAALPIVPDLGTSVQIATVSIVPSPLNPRKYFDPVKLTELASDIHILGVQQPLVVRPYNPAAGEGPAWHDVARYELVDGERRWRAACQIDLPEVPCIVVNLSDAELLERALSANMQRESLDPYSEGWGYKMALETNKSLTQEALGQRFGKSQTYVSRMVRLAEMPGPVTDLLACGKLDRSHGFALLPLMEHPEDLSAIAVKAVDEGWSSDALVGKVKLARTALDEANRQPSLFGIIETTTTTTTITLPKPPSSDSASSCTTPPQQPEVKENYTQADAKKEFEESGGPVAPRTETSALDAARAAASNANGEVTPAPRSTHIADETWVIWAEHKYGDVFTGLRRLKEMEDAVESGELLSVEDAKQYQSATTVDIPGLALTALTLDILAAARVEGTPDEYRLEDILVGWARGNGIDVRALIDARKVVEGETLLPTYDEVPLEVETTPAAASGMAALHVSRKLYDEILDSYDIMEQDGCSALVFRSGGKAYVAFPFWGPVEGGDGQRVRAKRVQEKPEAEKPGIELRPWNDSLYGPYLGQVVKDHLDTEWVICDETWYEIHDVTEAPVKERPKTQKEIEQADQIAALERQGLKAAAHAVTMERRDRRNALLGRIDYGERIALEGLGEFQEDAYVLERWRAMGNAPSASVNDPESSNENSVEAAEPARPNIIESVSSPLPDWLPAKLEALIAQQKESPNSTGSRLQTAEEMTADLLLSYIDPAARQFALRLIEADLGSRVCRLYTGQANMGYLIDVEAGRIQGGRIVTSKDIDWKLVLAHTGEWIAFLKTKSEKVQRSAKAPGMGWIEVQGRLAGKEATPSAREKKDSPPTGENWAKQFEERRQICVRIRAKEQLSEEDLAPWVDDPYVMNRWYALENSRKHLQPAWDQCLLFDISVEFAGRHVPVEVWCFPGTGPTNHLELYCDKETGPSSTGYRSCHCDPQQHPEYPGPIEFARATALKMLIERFGVEDARAAVLERLHNRERLTEAEIEPFGKDPYLLECWQAVDNGATGVKPSWGLPLVFEMSVLFSKKDDGSGNLIQRELVVWNLPYGSDSEPHLAIYCDPETGPSETGLLRHVPTPEERARYRTPLECVRMLVEARLTERFGVNGTGLSKEQFQKVAEKLEVPDVSRS